MTSGTYLHYAAEVSLYSGKTRAFLRYKGARFEEVALSRRVYREVIVPAVGRAVIPVVRTPEGEMLQDTTVIIDALDDRLGGPSVYPEGPLQRLVSLLLEVYGDEWLVMPAMHYRWHYKRENLAFILEEFGAVVGGAPPRRGRWLLGIAPALYFGGMYSGYFGITRAMRGVIEASYVGFLRDFDRHLAAHPYLLGTRPSIGDLGLVAPLYAHLYRDPKPGRLMRDVAPNVARWVERMQAPPEPRGGAFLPDDEVPQTLLPILRRMFDEQAPVLVDTIRRTDAWARAHREAVAVPRMIGSHRYLVGGVAAERKVTPYSQWMFQRPLDAFAALTSAEHARIDPVLASVGGLAALQTPLPTRLAWRKHRVVVEGRR